VPDWWPTAAEERAPSKSAMPTAKPPVLNPQLARIAEAVAAQRLEVLLEPIHALAEGRTRHFEVSVRLLTADGATLEQCDFVRATQGSGLMPRIDAERMIRAARVARRLGERGRHGSVLSNIAGESLTDAEFLGTAASHKGADGRMNLVLSFAQSEVRTFTSGHAEALSRLASAGFGFAMEDVTDLDMDFGELKAIGFEFVKLDAPVFLEGLAAPGGRIPASDICRHLSDFGLTLIVGRIEDDWLLARILGFGVLFGKGTLFGGPKLVKSEVVAPAAAA
jgi:cyclic-di-GMP phosphodiesterase TipF (flagellum assembly factor)